MLRIDQQLTGRVDFKVPYEQIRKGMVDVPIIERVGSYASPTVLIDGIDVMRPDEGTPEGDACRLDLPTAQRILDSLRKEPI